MAAKHALIVDDSRTARRFLARLLENHDLVVDTAESAEQALEHLSQSRPDVIFMDHMMPGMDGFQAVRAIKANPATATIPIMMYTSQAGDLYVGQARALGAVGVLPKQIKPVEVAQLLESLHLIPEDEAVATARQDAPRRRAEDRAPPPPGVEQVNEPADWSELHGWLAAMLDHHSHTLREDVEAVVARLLTEHQHDNAAHGDPEIIASATRPAEARSSAGSTMVIIALAAVAALFFWLHLDTQKQWRAAEARNAALLAELDAGRTFWPANDSNENSSSDEATMARPDGSIVSALEWLANQPVSYLPGNVPFGDDRIELVDGLLERLRAMDFSGVLQLESHVGDYCYVTGADGQLELAPPELPAKDCVQVGLAPAEAVERSQAQSLSFANYLASLNAQNGPEISVRIEAYGNRQPAFPYPPSLEGTTAGEWNEVALRNNQVRIRLLPDS